MKSRSTVGSRLANCELAKSDSDPKLEINVRVTEPKSLSNTLKALYNNSTVYGEALFSIFQWMDYKQATDNTL